MKIQLEIPDKDTKEVREAVDNFNTDSEIDKMNSVCFWLIKQCAETKADVMCITQEKVHQFGKQLGDYNITVKKV